MGASPVQISHGCAGEAPVPLFSHVHPFDT